MLHTRRTHQRTLLAYLTCWYSSVNWRCVDLPWKPQKVSPALFALDDSGNVGVRTINENNIVEFHIVDIVREDADGVWVSGLPEMATVITVGQELVVPGQQVEPYFEPATDMPAAAPTSTRPVASS